MGYGMIGEIDTRRFAGSTFTLLKAMRCIEKDCSIRPPQSRPPSFTQLPSKEQLLKRRTFMRSHSPPLITQSIRERKSMSYSQDEFNVSSKTPLVEITPLGVLQGDMIKPSLSQSAVAVPSNVFTRVAEDVIKEANRRQRKHKQTSTSLTSLCSGEKKNALRSGCMLPRVKERVFELVHPDENYYSKWERMKEARDDRELSLLRRNARQQLIKDINLPCFATEKLNLRRALQKEEENRARDLNEKVMKNKQKMRTCQQNILLQKTEESIKRSVQAHALKNAQYRSERMMHYATMQERDEKKEFKTAIPRKLDEHSSFLVCILSLFNSKPFK